MNSENQKEFLKAAENGVNIFLTGKAGTGKTFIVKKAIKLLEKQGKTILTVAPTGIAANNAGGQTIHSLFSVGIHGVLDFSKANFVPPMKRKIYKKCDTIIIDEISMLRPDVLDAINFTFLKNGCGSLMSKQIIFVGDMEQLQIVADDNMKSKLLEVYDGLSFKDAGIYSKLKVYEIELEKVHRQNDDEFISNLNIIRSGNKSEYFRKFVSEEAKGIILAPHNSTVKHYNDLGLKEIDEETVIYQATLSGKVKFSEFNVEEQIKVKVGAKIMYLCNSKNNNLVNGTLGVFTLNDESIPMIDVNGVLYEIEKREFVKKEYVFDEEENQILLKEIGSITQMPFKLAYALTIHKSQGLGFDEMTLDLRKPCFAKGQLYTALSRVKDPNGLRIIINK